MPAPIGSSDPAWARPGGASIDILRGAEPPGDAQCRALGRRAVFERYRGGQGGQLRMTSLG